MHQYRLKREEVFGGTGKYSYSREKVFYIGFNGIKITSEMLSEKGKNIYQEEYDLWEKENPDIDKIELNLMQKLEDKKRKLRITLFNRKNVKEEIADIEKELEDVRIKIRDGKVKKEKMHIFDNLTDEQKQVIGQYLESIESCEKIGKDFWEKIIESVKLNRGETETTREKWKRAFEKMVEDGAVSQETIDEVNSILTQEIEEKQDRYDQGVDDYNMYDMGQRISNAVSWYIKEREKNNQEKTPLQQKEEELVSLETEEKTIKEAELLIDKQMAKQGEQK